MIDLFAFDDHVIDTSTFNHYLHGSIVNEFENELCEYVGAKYAASFFSASYAIYSIIKSKVVNTPEIFSIPSMIPPVVPNCIVDAGAKITFNNDIVWVGNSYKLCDGVIDSAQRLDKNQFANESKPDDLMIFSMYPTKPLPSLDGGVVVSNNKEKIDDLKSLSFYGMEYAADSWSRSQKQVGFKAYMSTMQATIASKNLKNLDSKYAIIDNIRNTYNREFGLKNTSRHLYRIDVKNNSDAISHFKEKGITTGIHYKPQHLNPVFYEYNDPHEEFFFHKEVTTPSRTTLSIPLHHKLTNDQVQYIIKTTKESKCLLKP
jgi:UDP-4-amino-4,6-dideoxy-L-N-acetyl-beta-L-altrosamine transaminase